MSYTKNDLRLVCGDPREERSATFTRFVFPFAYKVERPDSKPDTDRLYYRPCQEVADKENSQECLDARRDYFTCETGQVLFEDSKWLQIDSGTWAQSSWGKPIEFLCRGKKIPTAMLPPCLVLFEWPEDKSQEFHIFQTGFLLVDLYFPETVDDRNCPDLTDLLIMNDLFRHFRCPYPKHEGRFKELLLNVPIEYEGSGPLRIGSDSLNPIEKYLLRWANLLKLPLLIDGKHYRLGSDEQTQQTYADNRTYVWSAAVLVQGVKSLQNAFYTGNREAHAYGHWIKLLNVDSPSDMTLSTSKIHNDVSNFERKWAEARTYRRWEEKGTWYGFNYHSGVMLCSTPGQHDTPFIRHFRQMYFDMALLLFYMRASLFRFSRELTANSKKLNNIKERNNSQYFRELRNAFAQFTIRYQFPLLSNQQQAIEMYALAREHFDVDELYQEVKDEIDNTHQLVELLEQHKMADSASRLNKYGIPLVIASLAASIFGMNAGDYPLIDWLSRLFSQDFGAGFSFRSKSFSLIVMIGLVAIVYGVAYLVTCKLIKSGDENE